LDRVPDWLSDVFCTLATGFGGRSLYQDTEESARYFQRPVILNGITDVTGREDLRSRTVVVKLETIHRRRVERVLWEEFGAKQGRLLGALLDALTATLRVLPNLDPDDYAESPRDFRRAQFVSAGRRS
jgi:putative DNA primase/helicase